VKWLRLARKGLIILRWRLRQQGVATTLTWFWTGSFFRLAGRPIWQHCSITPELAVGGQISAAGWRWLARRGFTAVVNMRTEYDDAAHGIAPKSYVWLPTVDDHAPTLEQLQTGVDFIRQVLQEGGKVYVHCASGVGRAPTMAAAYLISTGLSMDEALALISQVRPFVKPTPPQLEMLQQFAAEARLAQAAAPAGIQLPDAERAILGEPDADRTDRDGAEDRVVW
jgi:protein tyrosine phosphatase (PTP) superfamily phosphohydrolase (DUF442 family)